jgi:hypothetical protein
MGANKGKPAQLSGQGGSSSSYNNSSAPHPLLLLLLSEYEHSQYIIRIFFNKW